MSEIQFGELKQAEPDSDIRPDRDAHFCVVPCCGAVMPGEEGFNPSNLMIFVDLDVMRDMEAHAASDTSVELGGVMLGQQSIDENGRPFVVVTDALRAEDYQATQGTFTFTHDTWSRITERRAEYRPDLEMVGWYHTHPGFTVFLSGMDLFICNNFFNKPLDVALVIDPVNDERGWFQWAGAKKRNKRPTKGFYLISNQYRKDELLYFSSLYSGDDPVNADPRYSGGTFTGSSQPVVNIMESNRRPMTELAIVAMLMLQFMLLAILGWKLLTPAPAVQPEQTSAKISEQATADILSSIVAGQTGDNALARKFNELRLENNQLRSNLDGQMIRANEYSGLRQQTDEKLNKQLAVTAELKAEKTALAEANKSLTTEVKTLTELCDEKGIDTTKGSWNFLQYIVWALAAGLGGLAGFLFGRRRGLMEADDYYLNGPESPRDTPDSIGAPDDRKKQESVGQDDVHDDDEPDITIR